MPTTTTLAAASKWFQCGEDFSRTRLAESLVLQFTVSKNGNCEIEESFRIPGLTCLPFLSGCSIGVPSPSSSVQPGDPPPSTPASIAVGVTPGFTDLIAGSSLQLSASVAGDLQTRGHVVGSASVLCLWDN